MVLVDAVTYLRVSGDSQIEKDGFPRQRFACEKYAVGNDLQIVREFRDEGVTGKMELEGRAGLSDCLAFVRENEITTVLVECSDRMARDMIVSEVIVREFQKIGVRVISASGGVDLTEGNDANPTAKLVRQILAAVSEFDRCVIVLKTRAARQRIRMRDGIARGYEGAEALRMGRCEGKKPYGALTGETETIARMKAIQSTGRNYREVVEALNASGSVGRSGKAWTIGTVHKILSR